MTFYEWASGLLLILGGIFLFFALFIARFWETKYKKLIKKKLIAVATTCLIFLAIICLLYILFGFSDITSLGIWADAICMLCVLNSLIKDWHDKERIKIEQKEKSEYIRQYNLSRKKESELQNQSESKQ